MNSGLSDKEEELVKRLTETGMNKKTAEVLVYTAHNEGTKSREMESELGLRQPEVSVAVQILRENDWLEKEEAKKKGKGRPVHVYNLKKNLRMIVSEIEEREREKIGEIENNIEKIDELISNI